MYSIHNEGKSVVAKRFIRGLKTKICKYMNSISKNVYIDKLDDIVNEYNNTIIHTIEQLIRNQLMSKIIYIYIYIYIYIDFKNEVMIKILNLKLAIM